MEDTFYAGRWWRAESYELDNGYIRPVAGARFEAFDPLDDFQDARAARGESESPYLSLINVVDRTTFDADGKLTSVSRDRILDWCRTNGLLGILLHRVQQATFAPRWERRFARVSTEEDRASDAALLAQLARSKDRSLRKTFAHLQSPKPRKEQLFATFAKYIRTNWGSFTWGKEQELTRAIDYDAKKEGRTVEPALWGEKPGWALVQDLHGAEWRFEAIDATWARYFPSVKPADRLTFEYPQPYSDEFRAIYAEPLVEFLDAARTLRDAFLAASALKDPAPNSDTIKPNVGQLNALVAPVGPCVLALKGGEMEQRSVSTSLLGSLAIMAQQDLATDRRVIRCHNETCGLVVVAVGYQTKYCSARCRHASEKREQRARQKATAAAASTSKRNPRPPAGARRGKR